LVSNDIGDETTTEANSIPTRQQDVSRMANAKFVDGGYTIF
jgi:hypothetical protein